jgi:hypothetical protein
MRREECVPHSAGWWLHASVALGQSAVVQPCHPNLVEQRVAGSMVLPLQRRQAIIGVYAARRLRGGGLLAVGCSTGALGSAAVAAGRPAEALRPWTYYGRSRRRLPPEEGVSAG